MRRFDQVMETWLYGDDGYYSRYRPIGKEGDFYTAVSATPFFGGCIALRLIEAIDQGRVSPQTTVCEIGAHHGYLMADVIQFLYTLRPELLSTLSFLIVERFEVLREQQKRYLYDSFGDAIQFSHVSSLQELSLAEGFVFANEIFDAFTARIFKDGQEGWIDNDRLIWLKPDQAIEPENFSGEMAVGYEQFAIDLGNAFERCEFVTFDYGENYPRGRLTMRIFDKHTTTPIEEIASFESLIGRCDITYDVDFSSLIRYFEGCGWRKKSFMTQMSALVDFGLPTLLEKLEKSVPYERYLAEVAKVKILISPDGMGERFKMVSFEK